MTFWITLYDFHHIFPMKKSPYGLVLTLLFEKGILQAVFLVHVNVNWIFILNKHSPPLSNAAAFQDHLRIQTNMWMNQTLTNVSKEYVCWFVQHSANVRAERQVTALWSALPPKDLEKLLCLYLCNYFDTVNDWNSTVVSDKISGTNKLTHNQRTRQNFLHMWVWSPNEVQ